MAREKKDQLLPACANPTAVRQAEFQRMPDEAWQSSAKHRPVDRRNIRKNLGKGSRRDYLRSPAIAQNDTLCRITSSPQFLLPTHRDQAEPHNDGENHGCLREILEL